MHSAISRTAVCRFTNATTASGRSYQNIRLPLSVIYLLDDGANERPPPIQGGQIVTQISPSQPRGGCRQPTALARPTGAAFKEAPPRNNSAGNPQLVPSDTCALCKAKLEPLGGDEERAKGGALPTRVDTRERLQCERCQRVRYCDAWCAHIHYEACHKHVCPLPPFSTEFNAEYVVRRGKHVRIVPIHCVRQDLVNGGGLNAPTRGLARTHVWSAVPHATTGPAYEFCSTPVSPRNDGLMHHVWFVALVTRIRAAKAPSPEININIDWTGVPRWAAPMVIYNSFPLTHGPPRETWPEPSRFGRHENLLLGFHTPSEVGARPAPERGG